MTRVAGRGSGSRSGSSAPQVRPSTPGGVVDHVVERVLAAAAGHDREARLRVAVDGAPRRDPPASPMPSSTRCALPAGPCSA
ncbi:hypothetical protein [Cellulomonas sp. ATA003]|uniref:hypothetical protein n=1 Tax=Cellulomonas sp. ATA003 TaxID=3073064 RepID=UPI002872E148|nr:hypothetical protein [Cellulomonas sp. ATA003]WNB87170.1 hypothetical protein REH70_08675 [Cellulomonas sp. ATA003]